MTAHGDSCLCGQRLVYHRMEISALQVLFSSGTELKKAQENRSIETKLERNIIVPKQIEMQWKKQKRDGSPPRR